MNAIGVAVVGAGYWGPNLTRNLASSPEFDLRAICDLDVARAEAVGRPYGTPARAFEEVLADPGVEAVVLATPAHTHVPLALRALDAGKHVLVEKPIALSYDDAATLVAAADDAGRVLMCDHTYCYTPAVRKIRELVMSGLLGDIHFVDSVRVNLGLIQRDIDVLWDLAPHDLSILDFVLPIGSRPLAVAAQGADPLGTGRDCIAYLTLRLDGGAIGHVHTNWLSPTKVRTMVIGGSKRMLVWDDLNPAQRLTVLDRGVDLQDLDAVEAQQALISYRIGDVHSPALPEREGLIGVVAEYADCIRTGRRPDTDGRAGMRVLDVLEAATRSLRSGGELVALREEAHVERRSA